MIYTDDKNFREFEAALTGIELAYGSQGVWLEPLAAVNAELAGKCRRQLDRTHSLIREESPVAAVSQACAAMVKGIQAAKAALVAAKAPEVDKAYVTTRTPDGIKVRVYANRAAIPDTDGMGDVAMVSAEDLVKFIPDDVLGLLRAFPGASVSKMLDQRKESAVSAPEPSGFTPSLTRGRGKGPSSKAMRAVIDMPDDIPE